MTEPEAREWLQLPRADDLPFTAPQHDFHEHGYREPLPEYHPVRIKITIEPRWTTDTHRGEIELTERELDGKTPAEVEAYIDQQVAVYVAEECPYGWSVLDD